MFAGSQLQVILLAHRSADLYTELALWAGCCGPALTFVLSLPRCCHGSSFGCGGGGCRVDTAPGLFVAGLCAVCVTLQIRSSGENTASTRTQPSVQCTFYLQSHLFFGTLLLFHSPNVMSGC